MFDVWLKNKRLNYLVGRMFYLYKTFLFLNASKCICTDTICTSGDYVVTLRLGKSVLTTKTQLNLFRVNGVPLDQPLLRMAYRDSSRCSHGSLCSQRSTRSSNPYDIVFIKTNDLVVITNIIHIFNKMWLRV